MKIDLHGEAGLPYINRSVYTGSYRGMRYRLSKEMRKKEADSEETAPVLQVATYPEPFNYECTPEDKKEYADFPFTPDGFEEALRYLNTHYEEQQARWEEALKNRWK